MYRSDSFFYSDAFRCWRAQFWTKTGEFYDERWEGSLCVERKADADAIGILLPAVKSFSDFQLLISTIRTKIMANSDTGGYCYAYSSGQIAQRLHKEEHKQDILPFR